MKNLLVLFFILVFSSIGYSQVIKSEYNTIVDYDGLKIRTHKHKGVWFVNDSLVVHIFLGDSLIHKLDSKTSNCFSYKNDYNENVDILFLENGDVLRKNEKYPDQYIIYRKM